MTFLDFFAGIGGFHTGMELAGHKCIGFCEFDKYAVASYTSMYLITDEQREYLANLDKKKRQKEILKDEYRNGIWYSNDVRTITGSSIPKADCWCFGAPCQSFSIAGKRAGLNGESGLIREVFRILGEIEEKNRPEWLIYENVKGMLSSNRGFDYLAIQLAMDELGYDIEWQLFNSKNWGVPQNRERVYTIGHLRIKGAAKIFPITGADGENSIPINIIGHRNGYRRNTQIFDPIGITEALDTAAGGGRGHHTIVPMAFGIDYNDNGQEREVANCLNARYNNGVTKRFKQDGTAVCIPILTPDRINKRQNGRRFKENGDEAFTLTAQDKHGVAIGIDDLYANREIRFYENESPSLRSERNGLKVAVGVEMSGDNCTVDNSDIANCLNVNDQRKIFGANQKRTMVGHLINDKPLAFSTPNNFSHKAGDGMSSRKRNDSEIHPALQANCGSTQATYVEMEVNPGITNKDYPGIYVQLDEECIVYCVWYEKYECYITIRKLLPLETFRLQGFEDELFYRAEFVNSDSQLYKQSGNSVTVNIVYEIAKALKNVNIKK